MTAAALLVGGAAASAEDVTLAREEAPIKTVTVYAREALVEREASFEA